MGRGVNFIEADLALGYGWLEDELEGLDRALELILRFTVSAQPPPPPPLPIRTPIEDR